MWLTGLVSFLLLASPPAGQGAAPPSAVESPTIPQLQDVNAVVLQTVIADQWDRGMDMFSGRPAKGADNLDWPAIAARDKDRQAKIRALVSKGDLKSARDYQFAALVLQHSESAADIGLAHLLASTAAMKGQPSAKWLAAAALDRFLWNHGNPQVFGTQFKRTEGERGEWTMEPYDRNAIADSIRADWCVVSLSAQNAVLAAAKQGQPIGSTGIHDCK
jgi:hypothetical protein